MEWVGASTAIHTVEDLVTAQVVIFTAGAVLAIAAVAVAAVTVVVAAAGAVVAIVEGAVGAVAAEAAAVTEGSEWQAAGLI